jgi:iron-only hydrogenase group A
LENCEELFQREMLKVTINGAPVEVKKGTTILKACQQAGVYVPTLCNHPDLPPAAKCGVCVVKVNGDRFSLSCSAKVADGMTVETNSQEVKEKQKKAVEGFSDLPLLPSCPEIEQIMEYLTNKKQTLNSFKTNSLAFDATKCINCDRCIRACYDGQLIEAINEETHEILEDKCISCEQCANVCPTGALSERNSIPEVLRAIASGKTVVLQTAPSSRVAFGEMFGDEVGTFCVGKIIHCAKILGFKYVFDTNFGADMTIVEEGTELIQRIKNNGVMPMFTSCCPAWVNFVEKTHPELIPNLSTTDSPHIMEGKAIKHYWAKKMNIDPANVFTVSLMPCTAKKDEIKRKQHEGNVDAVLTVREFGKMSEQFGIDWNELNNETEFDSLVAESTGAAALFGVTGGVMEAALRYVHEELTNEKLGKVEYTDCRGFDGIRSSTINVAGVDMKIAVCNGIANAIDFIESGEWKEYSFIEVMSCPCGCIGGGGQPKIKLRSLIEKRAKTIYGIDGESDKPTSNDNNELKSLYQFLEMKPGDEKAHELLHTHYKKYE